jgi:type VI secretion system protein ImpF
MQGSILDRLIDQEPGAFEGPVQYRQLTFNQARAAVGRDLENLLNTKNFDTPLPAAFSELNRSVFVYGIPDFTASNPRSPSVKAELLQSIERAINLFEPRLQNVMVSIDDADKEIRNIKFRISALLVMNPIVESVSFDTYFDVNRCQYIVPK